MRGLKNNRIARLNMEIKLLTDPETFPSQEVLKSALGKTYSVFAALEAQLTQDEFALTFNWRYYNDYKAWLCKVAYKKKTVFWLSVWKGFFKTSFFFLKRHMEGIAELDIAEESYLMEKEWGKMIPVIFNVRSKKQFADLFKVVEFKKAAK